VAVIIRFGGGPWPQVNSPTAGRHRTGARLPSSRSSRDLHAGSSTYASTERENRSSRSRSLSRLSLPYHRCRCFRESPKKTAGLPGVSARFRRGVAERKKKSPRVAGRSVLLTTPLQNSTKRFPALRSRSGPPSRSVRRFRPRIHRGVRPARQVVLHVGVVAGESAQRDKWPPPNTQLPVNEIASPLGIDVDLAARSRDGGFDVG